MEDPGYSTRGDTRVAAASGGVGSAPLPGWYGRAVFEQELAFAHEIADRAAEISLSYFLGEFEVR